ncbi:MAG: hypothetical protein A3K09_07100 [Nitrospinae bacterium RIFCSPLOWO2_12_FULL_47_7]|nr:MAG: hypothetical protein A3K09_07100 [Nitrospinae bacterium RIFCSPLOWO2_12_FULL_47_7]
MDRWATPPPPPVRPEKKISPELMDKIRSIQFRAGHLASDVMAGEYASAFKGRGMEFSEVREYQAGDDVRLIDWNVTARMQQPYIKEFREERELTIMLIVDVSSSGSFGSDRKLKNEVAAEIASILAFLAIRNNDKIGLMAFSDKIEHYVPPKKGKAHIWNVIRTILNFNPEGQGTNLDLPLEYLLKVLKRKAVVFLISDFQAKGYEINLKLAARKHSFIAITITDPRETTLPNIGLIQLQDAETGQTILIDTRVNDLPRRFAELASAEHLRQKRLFHSMGIDVIEIQTDRSLVNPIIQYFKIREKKR